MRQVDYGRMLSTDDVIEQLKQALGERTPFAIVRVGDGENLVLAQETVIPIKEVVRTRWGKLSRTTDRKGIRLPHLKARDRLVKGIQRADIVGIPYYNDDEVLAADKYLRPLTDRCFEAHGIKPKQVCHTFVNRHMVEKEAFWRMLDGRRVAMISKWAKPFTKLIHNRYSQFQIDVVKMIPINQHSQIQTTIQEMRGVQCDLVLISAGVNAVVLASELKRRQGRVAVDFGKTAMFMATANTKRVQPWKGGAPGEGDGDWIGLRWNNDGRGTRTIGTPGDRG